MTDTLFSPLAVGATTLAHRVVMAPLTRMRAGPCNVPTAMNAEYYGQRASKGGLLISEATPVCPEGHGHPDVPGIYTVPQVEGWKAVTKAVHDKGGLIFMQLWHTGRTSHSSFQPDGRPAPAPSAIRADSDGMTAHWKRVPYETPRALETAEVAVVAAAFAQGARNAIAAGFDGVEIHGANGYLLEQFMHSGSNQRTDQYGGSVENRCRFPLEVVHAVIDAVGAGRTGIRLSPYGIANGSHEDQPMTLYAHLVREMAPLGMAYLHLIEPRASGTGRADTLREDQPSAAALFRPLWPGVLVTAGGFDGPGAQEAVSSGHADAVAFGRFFISNPDLPQLLSGNAPLTPYNRATFYGGGEAGYTDYPAGDERFAAG
jgi:N-ethylmaleimide reductase